MAKIEAAIKDAILRGARRQVRAVATPFRRDLRRLRRAVAELRQNVVALRAVAAQWQRVAQTTTWRPEVSDAELKIARLSPRLIQKLRARLGVSQTALAKVVGVSTGAVVQWERGRSVPSDENRKRLVAIRKLGRRDVKRLLAGMAKASPVRRRRAPRRRRRRARTTQKRK